ncbi:hypothetical protein BX264_1065 [Streptomyces sp. 2333.5]|uniref:hypothetical protein n=1 Tax=unclassified Streptomyces TaxID=2593676 RepID=UPI00089CFDB4|nr:MULTISPECIES: hypothetical protein [unclassified Streptomyces]PJJ00776.1 hypothetical protein BX264_1065 [Streptomyces sp. 2333.5]SED02013.1 hypothetical protein SAMN05428942_1068 [Streptomyces sp. 2112.2]
MPSRTSLSRRRLGRVPPVPAALAATLVTGALVVTGLNGEPAASAAASSGTAPAPSASRAGQWHTTPVPVTKGDLTAIAALSDKQAWAVGYRLKSATALEAVALRWDGTSWTQESTLPDNTFPQALAVRSATDIWTVGSASVHWDGTKWTTYQLAKDPGGRVVPDAVTTTSDGKAWTVGRAMNRSVKDGVPAIQSWDGKSWHRQTLPDVGKGELSSVTAVAPDDIWAVGTAYATDASSPQTALLLHWDGTAWKRITAPGPQESHNWLGGVTAFGADDVWAVGGSTSGGAERPYAVHWNGTAWTAAKTPDVADGRLRAVGRTRNGELWAVGGKGAASVALRWNEPKKQWDTASSPGLVVRGFTTVPRSADLWAAGIAEHGDLVPTITRLKG